MSRTGEAYINVLNTEEDERQRQEQKEFRRQERLAGERWADKGLSLKVMDPKGGRKRLIVNPPVYCVQCGEAVSALVFCSQDCEKSYNKDVVEWLDGIESLLPSNREKKEG